MHPYNFVTVMSCSLLCVFTSSSGYFDVIKINSDETNLTIKLDHNLKSTCQPHAQQELNRAHSYATSRI